MSEKDIFLKSFEDKLKEKLDDKELSSVKNSMDFENSEISYDYEKFREEKISKINSFYERSCNFCAKYIKIAPDKKLKESYEKSIYNSHLNCSSVGVMSFTFILTFIVFFVGTFIFLLFSNIIGGGIIFLSFGVYFISNNIPFFIEKRVKAKANSQVILSIFYLVAYMRFSSNFERAVIFAANHLDAPLSLDFKRVLWEINNAKYPNIKVAFDDYLEKFREDNLEFLEAIYLIESSLYESEDFRRISLLDKSLDIILAGSYERIMLFSQKLREGVSTFNMLGVVLPILGLIILPLAASMGNPKGVFEIVLLVYDILIPAALLYFAFTLTLNKPGNFGIFKMPENLDLGAFQKYELKLTKDKSTFLSLKFVSFMIFLGFLFVGFLPVLLDLLGLTPAINSLISNLSDIENSPFTNFIEYRILGEDSIPYTFGPYGLYPALLSIFIPLSFAFGIGFYFKNLYKNLIGLRNNTKKLENQFPSALFQLGNRINEGISSELAFGAVSQTMKSTVAGDFFAQIDKNIKFNGMNIEKAIFDKEKGAINSYSCDMVSSSMKIFLNAINKGPEVAAKTLIDLSKYLSQIHLGNERMKDLLSESIGSMKAQIAFLAPMISGIIISIVYLVSLILSTLSKSTEKIAEQTGEYSQDISASILSDSMPTFLFQSVVGIYIVFLVGILVYVVNNLESGDDIVLIKYELGAKIMSAMTKYGIIVFFGILGFGFLGSQILASLTI